MKLQQIVSMHRILKNPEFLRKILIPRRTDGFFKQLIFDKSTLFNTKEF